MKDKRAYLLHAIDAIDAIQSYTVDGRDVVERELPVLRPQLEALSQRLTASDSVP